MKVMFSFILTLLQVVVLVAGLLVTAINTVKGLTNEDAETKKKAFKYFMLTIAVVFILNIVEFIVAFYVNP